MGHKLRAPQLKESDIMKRKISVYWPLALFVLLAAAAYSHVSHESATRIAQSPLAADQLSAELARTVSYGLVGGETVVPVKHMGTSAPMPAREMS